MTGFIKRMGLAALFVVVFFSFVCFAEESFTITTYYPSPYGSYNELQLYPHSSAATSCDSSTKGTMYYDSDDDQIYVCNGSAWVAQGGGTIIYLKCAWTGSACTPPSCPADWSNLGTGSVGTGGVGALGNYGYSERICRNNQFLEIISLKCPEGDWGASCTPPSCPADWSNLGTGCAHLGNLEGWQSPRGYCERICSRD